MPLDLETYVQDALDRYVSKEDQYHSFLLYGNSGAGKTYAIGTAPKPILLHSFDPGGWKTLNSLVESRDVIVDDRFEKVDDPFGLWDRTFFELLKGRVFESFATYAIDSGTIWANEMLETLARREGAKTIQLQHYKEQQRKLAIMIKTFASLPCNFILTGHIESERDETDGRIKNGLMIAGKAKTLVPMYFDEMYCVHATFENKKEKHFFQVRPDLKYTARSRMFRNLPSPYLDDASFKTVFRVAGIPFKDKEKLVTKKEGDKGTELT
jgi:hypothetical protein